jgi:hypothetical protein
MGECDGLDVRPTASNHDGPGCGAPALALPSGRLGLEEFGRGLLDSLDLDPVYVLLHQAQLERSLLRKWLLTYWCYYHVGTASWVSDHHDYWQALAAAAASKEYPRCHERRHYRGAQAMRSVGWLASKGLDALFGPLEGADTDLATVMSLVRQWVGFGPWIAFKVADMLERLGLAQVEFNTGALMMFDSPRQGARLAWGIYGGGASPDDVEGWAVGYVLERCGGVPAPPRGERMLNVQEAETILCKWKSHVCGRYTVGEDIRACRQGLLRFTHCQTSQRLLKAGRQAGLWHVA